MKRAIKLILLTLLTVCMLVGGVGLIYVLNNEYSEDILVLPNSTLHTGLNVNSGGKIVTACELTSEEIIYTVTDKETTEETTYVTTELPEEVKSMDRTKMDSTSVYSTSVNNISETKSLSEIFAEMGFSPTTGGGGQAETTSIDVNDITLPYDLPYELPKPMG